MIKQRCFKISNILGGNCKKESQLQCPETNKCISKGYICNNYDSCGDGSLDQMKYVYCNGKSSEILTIKY